jgi:hypothetical protein
MVPIEDAPSTFVRLTFKAKNGVKHREIDGICQRTRAKIFFYKISEVNISAKRAEEPPP